MHAIMLAHLPPGVRFTAVFDSCHSATALDLPYTYLPDGRLKSGGLKKAAGSTLQSTAMGFMRGGQIGKRSLMEERLKEVCIREVVTIYIYIIPF